MTDEEPKNWLEKANARCPWLKIVGLLLVVALVMAEVGQVLEMSVVRRAQAPAVLQGDANRVLRPERAVTGANGKVLSENSALVEWQGAPKPPEEEIAPPEEPEPEPVIDLTGKKLMALTFDDGPAAKTTPRLLDILRAKRAKATFFVVGTQVAKFPELVQRAASEGHIIGSHTYTHANLKKVKAAEIRRQTEQMDTLLSEVTGAKPALVRPPYGAINPTVRAELPQPMITWTIDPEDWKRRDTEKIVQHVLATAADGAILLLHDLYDTTVDAVPLMIDRLREQGYEFVTVPELAELRGVKLQRGVVYGSFRP